MRYSTPTWYRGVHFRSCLEARWAATLDQFGVQWKYEAALFELVSGRYIPDFWLPELNWWVEVKHSLEVAEVGRYKEVVEQQGRPFLILAHKPIVGEYKLRYIRGGRNPDLMGQFAHLPNSSHLWIADSSRAAPLSYPGKPKVTPPGLSVNSRFIGDRMNLANQNFDRR